MSTMNKAIKEAGIAIPANRRIWQWLKDNGPHTGTEVAVALKIKGSVSSSMLSQMVVRKMVSGEKKFSQHLGRPVTYYSAIGKTFTVLPLHKKVKVEPEITVVEVPQQSKSDVILSTLSITDARDLYDKLHAIFTTKG